MQEAPRTAAEASPTAVARACVDAHRAQDWELLRTLFHPEARIGTFAGGGRPEHPDEALDRLREAHQDLVYHADVTGMVELDAHAVLLDGHVRTRSGRGWVEYQRCWLYVAHDGLLYRSAVYESRQAARGEYERLGPTLGVD